MRRWYAVIWTGYDPPHKYSTSSETEKWLTGSLHNLFNNLQQRNSSTLIKCTSVLFPKELHTMRSRGKYNSNLLCFNMCLNCSITASVIAGLKKSFHSVIRLCCVESTKCISSCRQSLSSEQCKILIGVVTSTLSSNSCE